MGSFLGHFYVGIFLVFYGLVWIFLSLWLTRLQKGKSKRCLGVVTINPDHLEDRSKSYIPFITCLPLEPLGKIVGPILAITIELLFKNNAIPEEGTNNIVFRPWNMYRDDGSFFILDKLDHITMYFGFILSGVIDIVKICLKETKIKGQLFLSLAFAIEGSLLYVHGAGRSSLYAALHTRQACAALLCVLFSFLRVFHPWKFTINSGLGISIALQGTWLIQIGSVLYGKRYWDRENHENVVFVINCFIWHIIILVVFVYMLHFLIGVGCQKCFFWKKEQKEASEQKKMINSTDIELNADIDTI